MVFFQHVELIQACFVYPNHVKGQSEVWVPEIEIYIFVKSTDAQTCDVINCVNNF